MLISRLVHDKRHEILDIALSNGVKKIYLFGSGVRQEDTNDSDIDFLVEFEEGCTLFDLIRLKEELEELLNKPVDVVTENAVNPIFREQIINQAVQV